MPRKITEDACNAFEAGRKWQRNNSRVEVDEEWVVMYLFGHPIAKRRAGKQRPTVFFSAAGHPTNTTKDRLNGLGSRYGVQLWQQNWEWYWEAALTDHQKTPFNTDRGEWTLVYAPSPSEEFIEGVLR